MPVLSYINIVISPKSDYLDITIRPSVDDMADEVQPA